MAYTKNESDKRQRAFLLRFSNTELGLIRAASKLKAIQVTDFIRSNAVTNARDVLNQYSMRSNKDDVAQPKKVTP